MSTKTSKELAAILRYMAWERAKGELHSVIDGFLVDQADGEGEEECSEFLKLTKAYIETVDNLGLFV